ncbi:bifunctional diguanylate cyclase/phosphodiesterase [Marinomonas transparens]|uniref:EAL domain-containing protein n=1 Tax=Marinomonas transparens TaxID=2795388 RepID=A0A934JQM3_9GAMM|nr:EAL domain-containing protein [Marinomonas transparens]MBJ7538008.1 EAL domain-containing protein [Marinomonas transparens]
MLKSFQARLILFILVLLALAQLGTALAVLSTLKEDNFKQGVNSIDVARKVFDFLLQDRAEELTKGVEILTSDFGFKQAVATQEIGTIRSALVNHGARIDADLSFLVSPKGKVITATTKVSTNTMIADLVLEARRSGGSSISTMMAFDNSSYQLVLVPIRAPNIIAWVGMAFSLDQLVAEQIKKVTGLDVSVVYETEGVHRLWGVSTLPAVDKDILFREVTNVAEILQVPKFSNNEKYLSLGVDLGAKNQWGILHLPYGSWLESYENTRNQLLLIFAGALALALLLGLVLARNMTQPIKRLVEYVNQISIGSSRIKAPEFSGEFGVLSHTMDVMQDAIANREEELTYRASHDSLTGLYNQSSVESYLKEQLPRQTGCLAIINVQRFKNINNMLGYDVGNVLMAKVAERLQAWGRDAQIVARMGSDKFLLIFEKEMVAADCDSLEAEFDREFEVETGSEIRLGISIGVLLFKHTTSSVNDVFRRIDIIESISKSAPKSYAFYEVGQDESHQRQLAIIRDLPDALESGQLFVVYQPKVGVAQGDCQEAEALVRWQHPELGFVPPDEFITLLEHAGCIQILTKWMLKTVLAQLKEWWQAGHEIRVAVNLSTYDLLDEELPDFVADALEAQNLSTRALALEVTESAVMEDRTKVINVLKALQLMKIHLAIDDFGTGQSSLAYLRELPVNEVKIDRAFIQHMDTDKGDAFIVKASIDLSHSLGFQVTAEGAENEAGVALLRDYHCDKIQGYFFSKPLLAKDFFQWRKDFHEAKA